MLISKSKKLSSTVKKLSSFGYNKSLDERNIPGIYDIDLLGYNLRMSEVAASIGIEQIKKLSRFLISRRKNAKIIKNILRNIEDILVLPSQYKSSISSDFCVNIVLKSGNEKVRNSLILNLNKNNIGTSVHYPVCLPNSKFYSSYLKLKPEHIQKKFPVAILFAKGTISLPCGPHLKNNDAKNIAKIFLKCLKEVKYGK